MGAAPSGQLNVIGNVAELRTLMKIALPLMAAYLSEFAMHVTTKLIVGGLGYEELAAIGLASDLSLEILVILFGLLSIVGVFAAESVGAGDNPAAGHATRQGFIVATAVGVPAMVFIWNLDSVLILAGQDERVAEIAGPYVRALSGFIMPILWFTVLRNFVTALARTNAVMIISVVAVGLNYFLTRGLVLGEFGLPALGPAGAGYATTIVSWAMFAALAIYAFKTPFYRGYGLFKEKLRIDRVICGEIIRLGIPIAGLVVLEAGLFIAVSILSGIFGVISLAAYQVLTGWIGITFVLGLGMAEAVMVRVAYWIGRRSPRSARRAGVIGMVLSIIALTLLVMIPLNYPEQIVRVFLDPSDTGFDAVNTLAAKLLVIAAIFQVFDVLQVIAARALRGVKDTYVPLWIAAFGYWVMGVGGGCLLAFHFEMETIGLWWGMASGLIITATLLALRFLKLANRKIVASERV